MIPHIVRSAAATVLVATCISAVPATEPSTPPGDGATPPTVAVPRPMRPTAGPGGRAPSEQEFRATIEFARENMKNLYQMWQSAERGPRKRRLGGFAFREYRRYQQAKENDPEGRAEAVLAQIRSSDEIFALLQEYQESPADKKEPIRQRLREKMREVVDGMLQERQRRIERLKQMLQREERALENDRARSERAADERLEKLLKETRPASDDDDPTTAPVMDDRVPEPSGPPGRPR